MKPATVESAAMDRYLSSLGTLLTAIGQRPLSPGQRDRFAKMLLDGHQKLLHGTLVVAEDKPQPERTRRICRSCRIREVLAPPSNSFVGPVRIHPMTALLIKRAAVEFDSNPPDCVSCGHGYTALNFVDWLEPELVDTAGTMCPTCGSVLTVEGK